MTFSNEDLPVNGNQNQQLDKNAFERAIASLIDIIPDINTFEIVTDYTWVPVKQSEIHKLP